MTHNIEYVLPLGRPNDEHRLTSRSWAEFVPWILDLAEILVIWTLRPRADVAQWLKFGPDAELPEFAHPDRACALKGYRIDCARVTAEVLAQVPVSEETGVAFFSWQRGTATLATVDVDDFENFAILNVEPQDARRLAVVCSNEQWGGERFTQYRAEIDALSITGRWSPLSDVLGPP